MARWEPPDPRLTQWEILSWCKARGYSDDYATYFAAHQRCELCGRWASPPAHIRSRGAGGDDAAENLLGLCAQCHQRQHAVGWSRLLEDAPERLRDKVAAALERMR